MKNENLHATVLLADDHARILVRARQLLSPAYDVIAEVEDGRQAVEAVARLCPDVVVLDITMPQLDGLEAAREITKMQGHTRIVFLTVHDDEDYIAAALAAGASSYVLKRYMKSDLVHAVKSALLGQVFVSVHQRTE